MNDLEFNNKKQCGLWLMLVCAVIVIADIFGGKFLINPIIFLIGYTDAFYKDNLRYVFILLIQAIGFCTKKVGILNKQIYI